MTPEPPRRRLNQPQHGYRYNRSSFRRFRRVSERFRRAPKSFSRHRRNLRTNPPAYAGGHLQPIGDDTMKLNAIPARVALVLAFVAACATVPASASASETGGEPSIRINLHKLHLRGQDSMPQLYVRLQQSARKVCRDATSSSDSTPLSTFKQCYSATLDKAVQSARVPELTALHQERTGSRLLGQAKN
jgi:UrcA family protein